MEKARTHVIEFVGLPGVGKTWLVGQLEEAMDDCSRRVLGFAALSNKFGPGSYDSQCRRFLSLFPSSSSECRLAWLLVRYLVVMRPVSLERLRIAAGLLYTYQAVCRAKENSLDQLVLDQGLLQMLASLRIGGRDQEVGQWREIVRFMIDSRNYLDGVVYIEGNIQMALERIEERSSILSRFDRWSESLRLGALLEMETSLEHIIDELKRGQKPVLTVSAASLSKTNSHGVWRWMRDLWQE